MRRSPVFFVKIIESVNMKNLTLKMMMVYIDGNVVEAITVTILASETICSDVFAQFETEETEFKRLAVLKCLPGQCFHM